MPLLATQIDTVKAALQGKMLRDATDSDISRTLAGIYTMIGLRPAHFPTPQQDAILFAFLRSEFGAKTLKELVLAFTLAIKDELDIKPEDAKAYDQFTCEYVARIMSAYRKFIKRVAAQAKPNLPAIPFKNNITTRYGKMRDIVEWKGRDIANIELLPLYLYDYLAEFELIETSVAAKRTAMISAVKFRKDQLGAAAAELTPNEIREYKGFVDMQTADKYNKGEWERLKVIAKKIMVAGYYQKFKEI